MTRTVACPTCGVSAPWDPANPSRPFCNPRCKQIDLGQWASEAYRVPQAADPELDNPPEDTGH